MRKATEAPLVYLVVGCSSWGNFHAYRQQVAIDLLNDVKNGSAHATGIKAVRKFKEQVEFVAQHGKFESQFGLYRIMNKIRQLAFSDVRENERYNSILKLVFRFIFERFLARLSWHLHTEVLIGQSSSDATS